VTYVKPCQLGVDACQTPRWHQADASADIFVAHIDRDRESLGIKQLSSSQERLGCTARVARKNAKANYLTLIQTARNNMMNIAETGVEPVIYSPPLSLRGAAVKVYLTYAGLDIQARRIVEDMLLRHAFSQNGPAAYRKWKKSDECIVRTPFLELLSGTSVDMAEAWFDWASDTALRELPVAFCRGMILELLSDLVRLRFKEESLAGAETNVPGKGGPVTYYSPVNVRGAGIEVYRNYAELTTPKRRVLEDILLGHAFLPAGPYAYGDLGNWNSIYRRSAYIQLKFKTSLRMANAWRDWASETSMKHLGPDACRGVVRAMLSDLVRLKYLEAPLPGAETSPASKKVRSKQCKMEGNKR
jgi:hypothetical protein